MKDLRDVNPEIQGAVRIEINGENGKGMKSHGNDLRRKKMKKRKQGSQCGLDGKLKAHEGRGEKKIICACKSDEYGRKCSIKEVTGHCQ